MIGLRPILMTTMAMVFGAFPLAFIYRTRFYWSPSDWLGNHRGLLFGTFSLIVVSITYSHFVRFKKSFISSVSTN
ncbi:MAG: hypothetical protein AB8V52_02460 [Coxiella endosymbiont of Dermacentor nuttalli]